MKKVLLALTIVLLIGGQVFAAGLNYWRTGTMEGIYVSTPSQAISGDFFNHLSILPVPGNSAVVMWRDARDGGSFKRNFMQKLDPEGNKLWVANGLGVSSYSTGQEKFGTITNNVSDRFNVQWYDKTRNAYFTQRIDSSGTLKMSPNTGVLVRNQTYNFDVGAPVYSTMFNTIIAADSGNTIHFANDDAGGCLGNFAQKMNNTSGAIIWGPTLLCTAFEEPYQIEAVPDSLGGAIAVWTDTRLCPSPTGGNWDEPTYFNIVGQVINTSGSLIGPTAGITICAAANEQWSPKIVQNLSGEAIITWLDKRAGSYQNIYLSKLTNAGIVQWTLDGVPVSNSTANKGDEYGICENGQGGVFVVWSQYNGSDYDIYAQKVTSGGGLSWGSNGVLVCNASASQVSPEVISDGNGGAIISWADNRSGGTHVYAQHLDSSAVAKWTSNGMLVDKNTTSINNPVIATDGVGGAIVSWYSNTDSNIYAQRITDTINQVYISPTGSDTIGTGTISNPFMTLKKAFKYVPINGEVRVMSGVYQAITAEMESGNMAIWPARTGITLTLAPGETSPATFDAMALGRHISFEGSVTATIKGLNFVNGLSSIGLSTVAHGGSIYYPYSSGQLTFKNCVFNNNRGPNVSATRFDGGAIYCLTTTFVSECAFTVNNAANTNSGIEGGYGGAIYISNYLSIFGSTFLNNFSGSPQQGALAGKGGAVYFATGTLQIDRSVFKENYTAGGGYGGSSGDGGAVYSNTSGTIRTSTFEGNYTSTAYGSSGSGGAMYIAVSPTIFDCSFIGNRVRAGYMGNSGSGGALYVGVNLFIDRSRFEMNTIEAGSIGVLYPTGSGVGGSGGAIYASWVGAKSCLFVSNKAGDTMGNAAGGSGGAVYTTQGGEHINCTYYLNKAGNSSATAGKGGALSVGNTITVRNSIFLDNSTQTSAGGKDIYISAGSAILSYSDMIDPTLRIAGTYTLGSGNITDEPQFVSVSLPYDLQLQQTSKCIDSGTSSGAPNYDVLNVIRPQGLGYDMGAYEFNLISAPNITRVTANGVTFVSGDVMKPDVVIDIYVADTQGISTASLYVDGSVVPKNLTLRSGTIYDGIWTTSLHLGEGRHDIRVLTVDPSGKNRSTSYAAIVMGGGLQMVGEPFNFPNPFRPLSGSTDNNATNIQYTLTGDAPITLIIYDITGHEVKRISSPTGQNGGRAGINSVVWNGKNLGNETVGDGMYLYKIITGGKVIGSGKLVVLD